jgi:multidrug efflux pump subunit AcrA (membrane-fusion protein)
MARGLSKKAKFLIIAAVLVAVSVWFMLHPLHQAELAEKRGNRAGANATAQAAKATLSVEATSPAVVQWPMTLVLNGSIYPWQEAQVSAEISGLRIQQVLVEVGAQVSKGQPLVLLADETVKADLQK